MAPVFDRSGPYRAVLATPGVRALVAVGFLARVPVTASLIALTLHVVLALRLGYGAAGLVTAAATVGLAIGAPTLGRLVDRRGLRTMLAVASVAECVFWPLAPVLSYPWLLVGAFLGGLLGLPVHSVVRQALGVRAPPDLRRPAFALDSMSVEISFIVGPALGTVLALQLSTAVALWSIGVGRVVGVLALALLNPPTRAGGDAAPIAGRGWLTARLGGALLATGAAVFVLFGTELVMVASLQTSGQTGALPLVNGLWCVASLAGGFAYGLLRRGVPLVALVIAMAVATVPLVLAGPWWALALLLLPPGFLCAPALAAGADTVSGLAPEHARGLVLGLHGSAMTTGGALATPLTGVLIDAASPHAAILVVAAVGVVGAAVAGVLMRRPAAPAPAVPVPVRAVPPDP